MGLTRYLQRARVKFGIRNVVPLEIENHSHQKSTFSISQIWNENFSPAQGAPLPPEELSSLKFFWRGGRVLSGLTTEQCSQQHSERAGLGSKSRIPFTKWLLGTPISNAQLLISTGQPGTEKNSQNVLFWGGPLVREASLGMKPEQRYWKALCLFQCTAAKACWKTYWIMSCSMSLLVMTGQH